MSTPTDLNLLEPVSGTATDAGAATFSWETPRLAAHYRLQIARDDAFNDVVFDAQVPGTTSLTLFNTLRARDDAYFWRVQPLRNSEEAWSEVARFHAVSDVALVRSTAAAPGATRAATAPASGRPAVPRASVPASAGAISVPYLQEATSSGMSIAVLMIGLLMLIGIGLLAMMGRVW